MKDENAVKVTDLRKVYLVGDERIVALNRINLVIPKGQVCCILGTSGSGKSTLLNMLAGLERPTKGDVFINGIKISTLSEKKLALFRRRYVGFVFQSYNLMAGITALENVAMPLMFRGIGKKKRAQLAAKMLKLVGLGERIKHKPTQMSGGQQQRVGIARAFVSNPSIVFADEPTGNLDTKTSKEVMEIMVGRAKQKNHTLIIVTHDRDIASYADRIIHIIDGNIAEDTLNDPRFKLDASPPTQDLPTEEGSPQQEQTHDTATPVSPGDEPLPDNCTTEDTNE